MLACRDGCAYTIKKGNLSNVVVELSSHAVGLERLNKVIYIGCMDDTLSCYSTKGKRLWTLPLPASITTMSLLHYRPRNLKAVVVALANGEVRLYVSIFLFARCLNCGIVLLVCMLTALKHLIIIYIYIYIVCVCVPQLFERKRE